MVPNDYIASEFRFPRLTLQSTKRYRLVTSERRRLAKDGPGHHWRNQGVPSVSNPPSFTPEHLTRAVGYGVSRGKPMPQSMVDLTSPVSSASPSQVSAKHITSGPLLQQQDNTPGAATPTTAPFKRKRPAADHLDRSTSSKSVRATPPPPHAHPDSVTL